MKAPSRACGAHVASDTYQQHILAGKLGSSGGQCRHGAVHSMMTHMHTAALLRSRVQPHEHLCLGYTLRHHPQHGRVCMHGQQQPDGRDGSYNHRSCSCVVPQCLDRHTMNLVIVMLCSSPRQPVAAAGQAGQEGHDVCPDDVRWSLGQ